MIAKALAEARGLRNVTVHAAGVSNSGCTDPREFERDRDRLIESLRAPGLFVYISTCSIEDKPYTAHKRAMEELVKARGDYLIARLPIVAGTTLNPHTLLNFLAARISRGERFTARGFARRNIIDVVDVAAALDWLVRAGRLDETVNIAAPMDYAVGEIISAFEWIYSKHAQADWVQEGDAPRVDWRDIADAGIDFSGDYLQRTLGRYYG